MARFGDDVAHRAVQWPLDLDDVLVPVAEGGDLAVIASLVGDVRVLAQDRFALFRRPIGVLPGLGEPGPVRGDVVFVPGDQDRLDVREVRVQRRAPDPGFFRDV